MTLALLVGYVAGWLAFTVPASRWAASSAEFAQCDSSHSYRFVCKRAQYRCRKPAGDVTLPIISGASALGLIWPVLIFPALAFYLATRKPTPAGMQRRIAELEREVGI